MALIALSVLVRAPKFLDLPAAVGSAIVIAFCVSRPGASRWSRWFVAAGAVSYSVYLWHEAIVDAIDRPNPTWLGALLALASTLAIAIAVYVCVEAPANRLAREISRRMARGSIPSAGGDRETVGMPAAYATVPLDTPATAGSGHG